MKKSSKIILVCVIACILLILVPFTILVLREVTKDLKQEAKLDEIVQELSEKDLTKDEIDMTIYTKGDYAVVEKTIKEYLNEYSKHSKSAIETMNDDKFSDVLTTSNYVKDGKEFVETKKYIEETRKSLNADFDYLIEFSTTEAIMKKIDERNLDSYYVDLYRTYMFDKEVATDLKNTKEELEQSKEKMMNIFDIYEKAINLLADNPTAWYIEDGQLYITNNVLLTRYNAYISSL